MTPVEIEMLVNWVEGGAPEGDPAYLPAKPDWSGIKGRQNANPASENIAIEGGRPLTLQRAVTALAIEPRDLPAGVSLEVTAYEPDGTVEHLVWLRKSHVGT